MSQPNYPLPTCQDIIDLVSAVFGIDVSVDNDAPNAGDPLVFTAIVAKVSGTLNDQDVVIALTIPSGFAVGTPSVGSIVGNIWTIPQSEFIGANATLDIAGDAPASGTVETIGTLSVSGLDQVQPPSTDSALSTITPSLINACSSASALTCDIAGGTVEFQAANAGDIINTAVGVYSPTGGGLNWAYNVTFGGSEPAFTGSETTATSAMNSTAITDTVVRQGRFIIDPLPTNPDAESTVEINGNDVINIKRVNAACLGSAAQKFNLVLLQFVGLECVAAPLYAQAINIQRGTLVNANVFPISNLQAITANGRLNSIHLSHLGLTSAQVDSYLIYLESILTTPLGGVGDIIFTGAPFPANTPNQNRTSASDVAVSALTARGWTVN